ncbi:MAG TPA: AAA family ATPase [Longimicrobiales bacterium]|nr:AAA family ATPase [Longimicrobiales bacterium]
MTEFRLRTLGTLRLEQAGSDVMSGRRRELALLVYVARAGTRPVSRATLAALFWGERREARARQSLRQGLLELRRVLGDALDVSADTVALKPGVLTLDVAEVEAGLGADQPRRVVELCTGEFMPGAEEIGGEAWRAWVDAERAGLRPRLAAAFAQLTNAAESAGARDEAESWAAAWATALPWDEAAHTRWIQALRANGRAAEAAAQHAMFSARLRGEAGVEPSPEWQRLGAELERDGAESRVRTAPGSAALFAPDMVGRGAELAELAAAWRLVRGGGAGVMLVEGAEGIGRTRLCDEFLRSVELDGHAFVLRVRGGEPVSGRDAPWTHARRLLAPLHAAPGLSGAPDNALAEVSRLVPAIRERYPSLPQPAGEDGARTDTLAANALTDALARVLSDVAAEVPVVVFIDDAHLVDARTRAWLASFARDVPPHVMLLLTAGPDDLTRGAYAVQAGAAGLRRIRLQPLDVMATEALLASMLVLPAAERHELAARLHDATEGNPFYTAETVAALVDERLIVLDAAGTWRLTPECARRPLPLAGGVRDAIGERIARLDDAGRRVLAATASSDGAVGYAELQAGTALQAGELRATVDDLIARRLLRPVAAPEHGVQFTHGLIRRVARERLAGAIAPRPSRLRRVALATSAVISIVFGVAFVVDRTRDAAPAAVAVMYLENLSADTADSYLAAALTEEIAAQLGQLERLRVKSPRAALRMYERADGDPSAIGAALGVGHLVDGSVRRAGDQVRVMVRLINAADGFQVWSETYDVEAVDLLRVQTEIAREVATRVAGRLERGERDVLSRPATTSPLAYDHYLRGNHHLVRRTPESVQRAIEEYRRAVRLDPGFSAARAREAYGYALFLDWGWTYPDGSPEELLARGLLATEQVLRGDPESADAWMTRGYLFVMRDPVRHAGAVDAFLRSIAINPGNAEVHHQLGQTLMALGRYDEAEAAYHRALELEPWRAMTLVPLSAIAVREGRHDEEMRWADSAIAVAPDVPYAYSARGIARLRRGDAAGALRDAERALQLDRTYPLPGLAIRAAAHAALGNTAAARRNLQACVDALADPAQPSPTELLFLGVALLALDEEAMLIDAIERTRPRSAWVWFYLQDPLYDHIRKHPRARRVLDDVKPA